MKRFVFALILALGVATASGCPEDDHHDHDHTSHSHDPHEDHAPDDD